MPPASEPTPDTGTNTTANTTSAVTPPSTASPSNPAPLPPPPAPASDDAPSVSLALLTRLPLYPAEAAASPAVVCVTGITGFLAGPIIERLLRAGHTVRGTCRNPNDTAALAPLLALPGARERLSLFKADLTQTGSFDSAIAGCDYVIHTAAPVFLNKVRRGEGRAKIIEPMLAGVENVLGAVNRTPSVCRVVLTSSISALHSSARDRGASHTYGESDWNTTATDNYLPYALGKAASERRAWEIARAQSRWRLVALLPSVVFGPSVLPCGGSESVSGMRDVFCSGVMWPACAAGGTGVVDSRDVAAAHCLAMVAPGATGRYILNGHSRSMLQLTAALASRLRSFRPALTTAPYWLVWLLAPALGLHRDVVYALWGEPPRFDTARAEAELGLCWRPLGDTLADMVADMAAKGLVRPQLAVELQ